MYQGLNVWSIQRISTSLTKYSKHRIKIIDLKLYTVYLLSDQITKYIFWLKGIQVFRPKSSITLGYLTNMKSAHEEQIILDRLTFGLTWKYVA